MKKILHVVVALWLLAHAPSAFAFTPPPVAVWAAPIAQDVGNPCDGSGAPWTPPGGLTLPCPDGHTRSAQAEADCLGAYGVDVETARLAACARQDAIDGAQALANGLALIEKNSAIGVAQATLQNGKYAALGLWNSGRITEDQYYDWIERITEEYYTAVGIIEAVYQAKLGIAALQHLQSSLLNQQAFQDAITDAIGSYIGCMLAACVPEDQ